MNRLQLGSAGTQELQVLCLGAHSDDIEIGCGATLLRLLAERPGTAVHWVLFSGSDQRADETRRSADLFLANAARRQIDTHQFRDGYFPYTGAAIKDVFEQLKRTVTPDLIFTHYGEDHHQDHRMISQLTWNTYRDHFILEYEIPKYDGGLTTPNVYVPVDQAAHRGKIDNLMQVFATQRDKRWFSDSTFSGLMRIRGVECASPTGYAEGFHGRKISLF